MVRILIGEFNVDGLFWATEGTGIIIGDDSGHDIIEVIMWVSMGVLMGWVAIYYELY